MAEQALDEALDAAGLQRLEALSDGDGGFDARSFAVRLISGEGGVGPEAIRDLAAGLASEARREAGTFAGSVAAPLMLCALLRLLFGSRAGVARAPAMLCGLCCATVLARSFAGAMATAQGMMTRLVGSVEAVSPVLASAMAVGGSAAGAAIATPLASLCGGLIEELLCDWGIGLCRLAAAVAAVSGVSGRFSLSRLFSLVRSLQHWLLGACMLAFAAVLSARGAVAVSGNAAALRAAQSAIEGAIPIIGGELSDAAGALSVSVGVVRSAVGVTGVAALLYPCAAPMLRLMASTLVVKVTAAVAEPVADETSARLLGQFGEAMEMLLAVCGAGALLALMYAGSCVAWIGKLLG